jgi:glycosyltransferase involved in cell wall biosynthesis
MIGQKGVPAAHGGVERHVEELGARLVALGHEVTVFTRPNYTDPTLATCRGMRLRSLPTIGTKHLDAIVHSLLATIACWGGHYDVVHYHAIGPCLASPLARLRGRRVVATIHGQDWRRGKWGAVATNILRLAEWVALHAPNATICVSESLSEHYRQAGLRDVAYIPNGIAIDQGDDTAVLIENGLADRAYILFAGRLVPEKGAHYLTRAHRDAAVDMPLVIAGEASMSDEYVAELKSSAGDGVRFVGYEYGSRLAALFRHAALFVLPSDVEGLPIVLLEALAYGAPILASDIAPNIEILGEKGCYFAAGDVEDLSRRLSESLDDLEELRAFSGTLMLRARHEYDWDRSARSTSELYERVVGSRRS